MTTTRQHIEACLTKVRATGIEPPMSARSGEGFRLMVGVWLDKLQRNHPKAVEAAFDRWTDEQGDWPKPHRLVPMVWEEQRRIENPAPPAATAAPRVEHKRDPDWASPDDIRATCRLVEELRGEPHRFLAPRQMLEIGEFLIARHIAKGRAPSDVADWYGHLTDRYPQLMEAAE